MVGWHSEGPEELQYAELGMNNDCIADERRAQKERMVKKSFQRSLERKSHLSCINCDSALLLVPTMGTACDCRP